MALPKFSQTIPGANGLGPDNGPVDRPNPLLNKTGHQNDDAFNHNWAQGDQGMMSQQPTHMSGMHPMPQMQKPYPAIVGKMPQTNPFTGAPVMQQGQPWHVKPMPINNRLAPRALPQNQGPVLNKQYQQRPIPPRNQQFRPQSPLFQPKMNRAKMSAMKNSPANNNDGSNDSSAVMPAFSFNKLAFNGFMAILIAAVGITGYLYMKQQDADSGVVAGIATTSEVVSQIELNVSVPNEEAKIYKIDDISAVQAKDPVFFAKAASGDYLVLYTGKSVLYRPSERKIIAVADKDLN